MEDREREERKREERKREERKREERRSEDREREEFWMMVMADWSNSSSWDNRTDMLNFITASKETCLLQPSLSAMLGQKPPGLH